MQSNILNFYDLTSSSDKEEEKESKDLIEKLLDHYYTNTITQNQTNFCFNVIETNGTSIKCGGLMKRLEKNFYSERKNAGKIIRKRGTSSIETGIRVHRQIHHLVQCERTGKCDCTVKTSKKRLHKYTKALFSKLKALGIEPIATEIPIYCKSGKFCTRLDMIGYQGVNKIPTIISLKTGYEVGFNRDARNTNFEKPFNDVPSTSQNINQLQACGEHQILLREYNLNFKNYYIMYMGKSSKKSKNSKKKSKTEIEDMYIETPQKWWWKSDETNLNNFYEKLVKIKFIHSS